MLISNVCEGTDYVCAHCVHIVSLPAVFSFLLSLSSSTSSRFGGMAGAPPRPVSTAEALKMTLHGGPERVAAYYAAEPCDQARFRQTFDNTLGEVRLFLQINIVWVERTRSVGA